MREEAEGLKLANAINGTKGGRPRMIPEVKPTGLPIGSPPGKPVGEPYPVSLIPNQLTPIEQPEEVVLEAPKAIRQPRVPAWGKAHNPEVIQAAQGVCASWPHPKSDIQGDGKTPVPHISAPEVAQRLAEIVREGGKLEICKAIATRAIEEFRSGPGKWIKAPQHFFGKVPDAPWRAYYQAHVTNEATVNQMGIQALARNTAGDGQSEVSG